MISRWLTLLGLLITCILHIVSTTQPWLRFWFQYYMNGTWVIAGPFHTALFTVTRPDGLSSSVVGTSCRLHMSPQQGTYWETWEIFTGKGDCHLFNGIRATATIGLVITCLVTVLLLIILACRLKIKTRWMMGLMILGWLSNLAALSIFFRWTIMERNSSYYNVDYNFQPGLKIFFYVILMQTISMCMLYATMRGVHQDIPLEDEPLQPQHKRASRKIPILTFLFLMAVWILEIVAITQQWVRWGVNRKLALFSVKGGSSTSEITPKCIVSIPNQSAELMSSYDCEFFNGTRAAALMSLLSTSFAALFLFIALIAPQRMCRMKVKTILIMTLMIFAWANNLTAISVFIGWTTKTNYAAAAFAFYPGFMIFFIMTLLHTICLFVLYRVLNSDYPVESERQALQPDMERDASQPGAGAQPNLSTSKLYGYGATSQPQYIPAPQYFQPQPPPSPYYAPPSPMLIPSGISLQPVPGGYLVPSSPAYPSYQTAPQAVQPQPVAVPVPGGYFVPSSPMQYGGVGYPMLYGAPAYPVLQQPQAQPWTQAQTQPQPLPQPQQPQPEPQPEPQQSQPEIMKSAVARMDDPAPAYQPHNEPAPIEPIPLSPQTQQAQRAQAVFDADMLGSIAPVPSWDEQEHEAFSS